MQQYCAVFVVGQTLRDFKTSTILVYMILNGKGCLVSCGLHGYGLPIVSALCKCIVCLFVCLFCCFYIS